MNHQLHAVFDGSHTEWCGQRGVDCRDRTLDRTQFVEIDEIEQRIGRRLGENQHRATRNHRFGECAGSGRIDESDVDAETRTHSGEQLRGAAVGLLLRHDVITLAAQTEHHTGDRTHPRGEGPRRLGPFQFRHCVLEGVDGGIAVAAVELGGSRRMRQTLTIGQGIDLERGRRPQDRGQGPNAGRTAPLHCPRLGMLFVPSGHRTSQPKSRRDEILHSPGRGNLPKKREADRGFDSGPA